MCHVWDVESVVMYVLKISLMSAKGKRYFFLELALPSIGFEVFWKFSFNLAVVL